MKKSSLFSGLSVGATAGFSLALVSFTITGDVARADSTVVYDNSTPVKDAGGNQVNYRSVTEFGDEITLAGVARYVTQFNTDPALIGNSFPNANFVIRFYKNDGADVDPGPKVIRSPGSLIWESSAQPVSQGAGLVTLAVPCHPGAGFIHMDHSVCQCERHRCRRVGSRRPDWGWGEFQ